VVSVRNERARLWLSMVAHPGDAEVGQLVDEMGALRAARVIKNTTRDRPLPSAADVDHAFHRLRCQAAQMLYPGHPGWPASLDDLGPHKPLALFVRGNAEVLSTGRLTGVVGTRKPSRTGIESATLLSDHLVHNGHTLVSGGALGIDAIAHRAALRAGAPTVAVMATGIDRSYPREHERLFGAISQCGAVVSERPPGASVGPSSFLARNRVIAALAHQSVVVECPVRSGALSTASHASALGRDLFAVTYATAGEHNAGAEKLIDDWGATPIGPFDGSVATTQAQLWPPISQAI
jgi:DNA processing protein